MSRAGRGGTYIEDFETRGYAAIGCARLGEQYPNALAIRKVYLHGHTQAKLQATANAVAMIARCRDRIKKYDTIISYDAVRSSSGCDIKR